MPDAGMRVKAFSSLRSRIWLAVGATALPIFVFSLFGHFERREAALRAVEGEMQHMLHMALVEERVIANNARQVLRIMARSNELSRLVAGDCNAIAGRLLQTQTDFANIGAVLPDGRAFCSGLPMRAPVNGGDRPWFKEALDSSDVSHGHYQFGRITRQRGVAYGYALRDDAGKVRAVLFAVTGTDWFDRMAEAVPLPRGWFALAADGDGHVLGRDALTPERMTSDTVDAALLRLLRETPEQAAQRVRRDGSERIVGLAPLANAGGGIHLVIGAPTASVLEPIDRVLYRDLGIVGLVFLASALLGWLEFRRSFGAWADRLRETVRRIGAGEALPPSLAESSVRELSELSAAFLQMKARLDAADRQRRADEAAVRESEERLRLALETGNEALWDWDVATGLAYCSPTWYTMLGYEPDEFPASYAGWEGLLHPADREEVTQRLLASIHGGDGGFEGSFRLRGKRGEWHWVQSRASVVKRDAHGRALRVVGTSIDISEQRQRDEEEQARADRVVVLLALNEYSARHHEKEFVALAADAAERITGSELGFIHFINEDQEHLDLVVWTKATHHDCLVVQADHYPVSEAGVWADCVRRRQAVVVNDYPALAAKKGSPPGHVRMERLLTVPIIADDRVVAVVGVANKADDYGSQDVESLDLIGGELWRIVRGRRIERSLAESERRLREMLETVDLVAVTLDRQGRVVFVNEYWAAITGWTVAEALGEDWFGRFLPEGAGAVATAFREAMASGELAPHLENEILTRDGGRRRIAWSNTLSRDAAGAIVGTISLGEDVTEKRRSEDALAASWERFYSIVNTVSEAIFLHDAATGRIVDVNDAATAMFGYSREELLSTDVGVLSAGVPPYTLEAAAGHIARAVAGEPQSFEWHARRRDGSVFWVEVGLRFAAIGGKDHVLAVVKDISERRAYEAAAEEHLQKLVALNTRLEDAHLQLLQSEKMASIGQLAAGVAHEINNPVGYVFSNIGSLEKYLHDFMRMLEAYEKAEAGLPEAARAELQRVRAEVDLSFLRRDVLSLLAESREGLNRVRKIVQDLKDFSRVGSADEWQWADVHAGLDSTLNIVWNELKYKTTVERRYGELPQVHCLPSQINQVFMNLLVNAAHAIEVKGVVTVRTGREGEEVWIEVEDTGAGIPPENLKRIFDPFFTTKPVGKGTGLGLSVSYSIVQKHRGRIEVKSEVGRGSTFRVWLPIDPNPENGGTAA